MSNNNNNQGEKEEKEEDTEGKAETLVTIPPPPLTEINGKGPAVGETSVPKPMPNGHHYQPVTRSIFPLSTGLTAADRIRFILGEDDDGPTPPQLFTELDELLSVDGKEMEWKETAR